MTLRLRALLLSCAWFAPLSGCSEDALTQLVVVVDSDWEGFERVEIQVEGFADDVNVDVEPRPGRRLLPRRLALVHDGGDLGPIHVTVRAFVPESDLPVLIEPRRNLYFVRGKTRMLKIDLLFDCIGRCMDGQACLAGPDVPRCVESGDPDAIRLVDWDGRVEPLDVAEHGELIDAGPDGSLIPTPQPDAETGEAGVEAGPDPDDAGGGGDANTPDADATVMPVAAFPYMTSNFDAEAAGIRDVARENALLDCGVSAFDSSTLSFTDWCDPDDSPVPVVVEQSDLNEAVVLVMETLTIESGSTLRLTGARPVILAVFGDARIDGVIDASAEGPLPGPGADRGCAGGAGAAAGATSGANDGGGGGGGGGFGSPGGNGGQGGSATGNAPPAAAGGAAHGSATLVPLRGGCSGGDGAVGASRAGLGGGGGGAVQISVAGVLRLGGTIDVGGGGGAAGSDERAGGGGGGSGGAIALEAAAFEIGPSAVLAANGGGGAAGQSTMPDDPETAGGADAAPGPSAAAGGDPGAFGGEGGAGAARGVQAEAGGDGTDLYGYGAGGGGGGLGRIVAHGAGVCTLPGISSPLADTECGDCGCPPEPPAGCQPVVHDSRTYYRCSASLDWDAARAACEALSLHLARIDDASENDALANAVAEDTWIGASDIASEGDWRWDDGTAFWSGTSSGNAVGGLYENWGIIQPDNSSGTQTNTDCAAITSDGTWFDRSCADANPYLCEP
jgi:hypothetical protein